MIKELVEAISGHFLDGSHYHVTGLTNDGYDVLDAIRDSSHWNRIKGYLQKEGLEFSVTAIKKAAFGFIGI